LPLPPIPTIKAECDINILGPNVLPIHRRAPVGVSIGPYIVGSALPHVDQNDNRTIVAGSCKRFTASTPKSSQTRLDRLGKFVRSWLRSHSDSGVLAPLVDVSLDTWLRDAPYTEKRKEQLRKAADELRILSPRDINRKHHLAKSFIKDEHYLEFKHARCINSRSDFYKCLVGPYFHAIENKIFDMKEYFIKHIPIRDRPKWILEHIALPGARTFCTDFSTFEAHFTKEIQETIEMELYEYMLQDVYQGREVFELIKAVQAGKNVCQFKNILIKLGAVRLSGEMCTSLGNGFTNLMLMEFTKDELGITGNNIHEGDDGLLSWYTTLTPEFFTQWFHDLGWTIKFLEPSSISEASFCGLIFEENSEQIIVDPFKTINLMGWLSTQYTNASDRKIKSILRCKALSYLYQYSGCPLVGSLARYIIRATEGIRYRFQSTDWWERQKHTMVMSSMDGNWDKFLNERPTRETRILFESLFKISTDVQERLECYFDSLTQLEPLVHHDLDLFITPDTAYYYMFYSYDYQAKSVLYPSLMVAQIDIDPKTNTNESKNENNKQETRDKASITTKDRDSNYHGIASKAEATCKTI
jgi:hypothetical protein